MPPTYSRLGACFLGVSMLLAGGELRAEPPTAGTGQAEASVGGAGDATSEGVVVFGAEAEVPSTPEGTDEEVEAESGNVVERTQLQERQPRSAPDALRWEPGVSIQQTSHAQASPYVRGLTGQRVAHYFDGIRLNHGIYRQGPNQYFFTVDSRILQRLSVVRGSASVRYGADAIGGAIEAEPVGPLLERGAGTLRLRPRLQLRGRSADSERGGRLSVEGQWGRDTAWLLGAGYRKVGLLESGGVVEHLTPVPDELATTRGDVVPWVPRFAEEREFPSWRDRDRWRTQLGTGFGEWTWDGRLEHRLARRLKLVAASYGYMQRDAPRTDKCPPPEAPLDECLRFPRQDRFLSYVQLRGAPGPFRALRLSLAWQRHVEARRQERPRSRVLLSGADRVDTVGVDLDATTRWSARSPIGRWRLRYGADAYLDKVRSEESMTFTDVDVRLDLPRGQYLDGSSYATLGAWLEGQWRPWRRLTIRAGGRAALVDVRAPGDPDSGSAAVERRFPIVVGRAGAVLEMGRGWRIHVQADQGYRAPNLDDLTGRQQTGPGFQFENPSLRPERAWTFELGVRRRGERVDVQLWGFATRIDDAIQRVVRETADCPPQTPACGASRNPFQLVNLAGEAWLLGAEGALDWRPVRGLALRATVSWAWGEGPNPGGRIVDPALLGAERLPLSRVPPLHGTLEARYRDASSGLWGGAGLQWALAQRRLAVSDRSDPRIPAGGTPGYAVMELRGGWRWGERLAASLVVENIWDEAWRSHGSSILGPGLGIVANLEGGFDVGGGPGQRRGEGP